MLAVLLGEVSIARSLLHLSEAYTRNYGCRCQVSLVRCWESLPKLVRSFTTGSKRDTASVPR